MLAVAGVEVFVGDVVVVLVFGVVVVFGVAVLVGVVGAVHVEWFFFLVGGALGDASDSSFLVFLVGFVVIGSICVDHPDYWILPELHVNPL